MNRLMSPPSPAIESILMDSRDDSSRHVYILNTLHNECIIFNKLVTKLYLTDYVVSANARENYEWFIW